MHWPTPAMSAPPLSSVPHCRVLQGRGVACWPVWVSRSRQSYAGGRRSGRRRASRILRCELLLVVVYSVIRPHQMHAIRTIATGDPASVYNAPAPLKLLCGSRSGSDRGPDFSHGFDAAFARLFWPLVNCLYIRQETIGWSGIYRWLAVIDRPAGVALQ